MPEIGTSGSMSGDGKRSAAAWPKLPRPSSTLPWVVKDRFAHAGLTDTKRTRSTTGKGRAGLFVEPTRTSRCRRIRSASR
jgi:hypothetical protein